MKTLQYIVLAIAILLIAGLIYTYSTPSKADKVKYASENKPTYIESEINNFKRELDNVNLEKMRIQAKLDSCKYFTEPCPEVVSKPKSKGRPKTKTYKAEYDSTLQLLNQKRIDNANLEINLTDQINFKNRQMDTCSYYVREMDKALTNMSNDISKLNTEKDSLANILNTPISITKEFPCLKAKKGTVVVATVIPNTGTKDFTITNFNLPKDKYKVAKKSCKKVQAH